MSKKASDFIFDERSRDILLAIVKLHIATGEAVGSRTLSKNSKQTLSAATIRNIMADLEEAGYLSQPHPSAGRIPTDKGYRYYVDNLIRGARVSRLDEEFIHRSLLTDPELTRENLLERTSHLLSQISHHVGIVLSPRFSQDIIQHIEFIRLSEGRILVIVVSRTGIVHDCVVRLDEDLSQDELNRTSRYLSENFKNCSLGAIREELLVRMTEEKALYDRLLKNAILLCTQTIDHDAEQADVYVDGTVNMLNQPDFVDLDRMRALFRMFEEKGRLVKILNKCLAMVPDGGIAIQIGAENQLPGMRDCTIITSPYSFSNQVIGGISIVGPTRMHYTRVISIVSYVSQLFNQLLNEEGPFEIRQDGSIHLIDQKLKPTPFALPIPE
ncbi:MAG: heat-inducible transcription repressor HrcA [Acidobacteria bacterium]|nr:heat-inducible transcription repressor HrcA [Acidobacteriota bacterium]